MKQAKRILASTVFIILLSMNAFAQDKYISSGDYTVTIHGTSNLHDWDETVKTITGDGIINWNKDGSFNLNAVNIKMVVHSIKSTEGAIMNNNTYKALKANSHPDITFALTSPVKSVPGNPGKHIIQARVNLTIAGVTKTFDMEVAASPQGHGKITFEGTKTIKMTDYDVKPPVALLGTLKTGNDITIHFKTDFVASN